MTDNSSGSVCVRRSRGSDGVNQQEFVHKLNLAVTNGREAGATGGNSRTFTDSIVRVATVYGTPEHAQEVIHIGFSGSPGTAR